MDARGRIKPRLAAFKSRGACRRAGSHSHGAPAYGKHHAHKHKAQTGSIQLSRGACRRTRASHIGSFTRSNDRTPLFLECGSSACWPARCLLGGRRDCCGAAVSHMRRKLRACWQHLQYALEAKSGSWVGMASTRMCCRVCSKAVAVAQSDPAREIGLQAPVGIR